MARKDGQSGDDPLWSNQPLNDVHETYDQSSANLPDQGQHSGKHPSQDTPTSSTNPLPSLKQFVVDAISYIPTRLTERRWRKLMEEERRRGEMQDIETRWSGSTDSPQYVAMQIHMSTAEEREEARRATMDLIMAAYSNNAHIPMARIQALFRDPDVFRDRFTEQDPTAWLSPAWFKRSPYSPVRLEAHPDLAHGDSHWRAAFEDLMNASLGKPMGSEEAYAQSTYFGPGFEWMLSLQRRGILPPLLPMYFARQYFDPKHNLAQSRILADLASAKRFGLTNWSVMRIPVARDDPDMTASDDVSCLSYEVSNKASGDAVAQSQTPRTELELYEATDALGREEEEGGENDAGNHSCRQKDPGRETVALTDYQMQLMLLEQQNRKRLLEARKALSTPENRQNRQQEGSSDNDRAEELWFAEQQLWDALDDKNIEAATKVINEWYDRHGDIEELFEEELRQAYNVTPSSPAVDWLRIWTAAVCQSRLPEDDPDRKQACSFKADAMCAIHDRRNAIQKYRNHLEDRYMQFTGKPADRLCSDDELEEAVARLEQEHENIEQMTGNMKQTPATDAPIKRVDVLSALTTTHTTRLPDGTITTKVVLKQRFADGREETTESVHTTNESTENHDRARAEEEAKLKPKGWFWT